MLTSITSPTGAAKELPAHRNNTRQTNNNFFMTFSSSTRVLFCCLDKTGRLNVPIFLEVIRMMKKL